MSNDIRKYVGGVVEMLPPHTCIYSSCAACDQRAIWKVKETNWKALMDFSSIKVESSYSTKRVKKETSVIKAKLLMTVSLIALSIRRAGQEEEVLVGYPSGIIPAMHVLLPSEASLHGIDEYSFGDGVEALTEMSFPLYGNPTSVTEDSSQSTLDNLALEVKAFACFDWNDEVVPDATTSVYQISGLGIDGLNMPHVCHAGCIVTRCRINLGPLWPDKHMSGSWSGPSSLGKLRQSRSW